MKREYTIGQIAKIINVARSTVINWVKEGRIEAFQLPGGNNRVTRENLIKFMRKYNIPLDFLDQATEKRILFVSDDTQAVSGLRTAVAGETGLDVTDAVTPFRAGLKARSYRPHLIAIDLDLPDLDARDACASLRADVELADVKIVAVTADTSEPALRDLAKQGFDLSLSKPLDPSELVTRTRSLLKI